MNETAINLLQQDSQENCGGGVEEKVKRYHQVWLSMKKYNLAESSNDESNNEEEDDGTTRKN